MFHVKHTVFLYSTWPYDEYSCLGTSRCSVLDTTSSFSILGLLQPLELPPLSVLTSRWPHSRNSSSSFAVYYNFLFFTECFCYKVSWVLVVCCGWLTYISVHLSLIQPQTLSQSCESPPNTFKHIRSSIHLICQESSSGALCCSSLDWMFFMPGAQLMFSTFPGSIFILLLCWSPCFWNSNLLLSWFTPLFS